MSEGPTIHSHDDREWMGIASGCGGWWLAECGLTENFCSCMAVSRCSFAWYVSSIWFIIFSISSAISSRISSSIFAITCAQDNKTTDRQPTTALTITDPRAALRLFGDQNLLARLVGVFGRCSHVVVGVDLQL